MIRIILAATAALIPVAAFAHDGLAIRDAYARSANAQTGAVFLVVENHRKVECRLTGVSSSAAEMVELHTHAEADGVMKMQKIEGGIVIPAGGEHALERGGDHVMLMGLTSPLALGDSVALTLDFGDCGTQQVEAAVDNDRAAEAEATAAHKGH